MWRPSRRVVRTASKTVSAIAVHVMVHADAAATPTNTSTGTNISNVRLVSAEIPWVAAHR